MKIVRIISASLCVIGFMLALGTVGRMDYLDEIGELYSIHEFAFQIILSIVFMIQTVFVFRKDLK